MRSRAPRGWRASARRAPRSDERPPGRPEGRSRRSAQREGCSLTTDPKPPEKDDSVTIQVSADSSLFWNREPMEMSDLESRITAYKSQTEDPRLLIAGDEKARFGFSGVSTIDLDKYLNKSVKHLYRKGEQTPFKYINC